MLVITPTLSLRRSHRRFTALVRVPSSSAWALHLRGPSDVLGACHPIPQPSCSIAPTGRSRCSPHPATVPNARQSILHVTEPVSSSPTRESKIQEVSDVPGPRICVSNSGRAVLDDLAVPGLHRGGRPIPDARTLPTRFRHPSISSISSPPHRWEA